MPESITMKKTILACYILWWYRSWYRSSWLCQNISTIPLHWGTDKDCVENYLSVVVSSYWLPVSEESRETAVTVSQLLGECITHFPMDKAHKAMHYISPLVWQVCDDVLQGLNSQPIHTTHSSVSTIYFLPNYILAMFNFYIIKNSTTIFIFSTFLAISNTIFWIYGV